MKNSSIYLATFVCAISMTGCATTAPLSFVDGIPQTKTDPYLYPLRIVSVDGSIQFAARVPVEPGLRSLVLEAAPGQSARLVQKAFVFGVEPCTSYHLAGRKTSPMAADWSLVVDSKEKVALCNPEEEFRKATSPASSIAASAPASRMR